MRILMRYYSNATDNFHTYLEAAINLKESVIYAIKVAHKQKIELVVGKEDGRWEIRDLSDPKSDQMSPSMIVCAKGIKYPEDEYLFADLLSEGE